MIIVKIIGGLGNQMFQIAYARQIAIETNQQVFIDTSSYKKYKIRNFTLEKLEIINQVKYIEYASLSKVDFLKYKTSNILYRIYQKLHKTLLSTDVIGHKIFTLLAMKGFHYNFDRYYYDVSIGKTKNIYIYGYFQSEKYFENNRDRIMKELKVSILPTDKESLALNDIHKSNSVAISMRLGDDYLLSKSLNVCTEMYYKKAVKEMQKKFPDAVFYVFSDDIERAKKVQLGVNCKYIEGFSDYESLRLMYSCNHFIIPNSSFSWWGAYLSNNQDKVIIAPKVWYNDSKDKPGIFVKEMTLLDI